MGEVVTPDAYAFTATSAVAAVERVLASGTGPFGATTPGLTLGRRFAESLPGVRRVR